MNNLVNKFCNLLMKSGNKSKAQAIFFKAFSEFIKISQPGLQNLRSLKVSSMPQPSKIKEITARGLESRPQKGRRSRASDSKPHTIVSHNSKTQDASCITQKTLQPLQHINCNVNLLNASSNKSLFLKDSSVSHNVAVKQTTSPSTPLKNVATKTAQLSGAYAGGLLDRLVENVRPCVEIRKVRKARITHQVPAQISRPRGQTVALRWIIELSHKRKQKEKITFVHALALELGFAHARVGGARQRRVDLHRLAQANHGNMHFRWW